MITVQNKILYFSKSIKIRTAELLAILLGLSVARSASGIERGTNNYPLSVRSGTRSNLPQGELHALHFTQGSFTPREKTLECKAKQTNNGSDGKTKDNGFLRE